MGLFDFLKPKSNPQSDAVKKAMQTLLPGGEADIQAGTKEVRNIIATNIPEDKARNIFLKSYAIASLTDDFDEEKLQNHLNAYCKEYFDKNKVERLTQYLTAVKAALLINKMGASRVRKDADGYVWG
jgi:predicted house-cleaning noncanonical NTP pyrophosphatase (MazG superfamily)